MATTELDAARTDLVEAVRTAIPEVREYRASNRGGLATPADGKVIDAAMSLLRQLRERGALDRTSSKRAVDDLPVSHGELGELVVDFTSAEPVLRRPAEHAPALAFLPDAGSSALVLHAVADRLAREIASGNFRHDRPELNDAVSLLHEQEKRLGAER
jgi:hypothetical protein